MKIERFNINYIDLAKSNIVTIENNKPKKFSIKAFWDEDFNRGYKIYKNKGRAINIPSTPIPTESGEILKGWFIDLDLQEVE